MTLPAIHVNFLYLTFVLFKAKYATYFHIEKLEYNFYISLLNKIYI